MTHNKIHQDLKAYIDNELPADRMREVEDAISRDPQLAEEVQFMRRLSRSFQALQGPQAVPQSAERIAQRIRHPRSLLRTPWVWASAAAVILIAIILPNLRSQNSRFSQTALPALVTKGKTETTLAEPSRPGLQVGAAAAPQSENIAPMQSPAEHAATETAGGTLHDSSVLQTYDVADRKVIREGSIHLKVESTENAEKQIRQLVNGWRGYVQQSQSLGSKTADPKSVLVVRVPEDKFEQAMEEFAKLGEKISSSTSGQDVTVQMVDLDARIRTKKAQEETYRRLLGQAKTVGQVIEVQDRLSEVRAEIESLEAVLRTLKSVTSLATITVTLEQRPKTDEPSTDPGWVSDAWATAVKGLKAAWQAIATAIIFIFVYSPIWLPALFAVYILSKRFVRR